MSEQNKSLELAQDSFGTPLDHYRNAQQIAFAPLTFQAARIALERGVLAAVEKSRKAGVTIAEVAAATGFERYALRVLLEGCLSLDLVSYEAGPPSEHGAEGRYRLTLSGKLMLRDPLVGINMRFVHDVCYRGAFDLERSLDERRPVGLETFGGWRTIYEGLAELPAHVKKSWFDFDHQYSDGVFPVVAKHVLEQKPGTLLDVGGNTGKWALLCTSLDAALRVTILDHPGQLEVARANAEEAGMATRIATHPTNLLDHSQAFPRGFDAVWMSQFLDCFPERDIVALLRRGRAALAPGGTLYVLESFWDRQATEIGRNAVTALSLYFTCIANGTSRMYHSDDLRQCVREAGLVLASETELGSHTLFACTAE